MGNWRQRAVLVANLLVIGLSLGLSFGGCGNSVGIPDGSAPDGSMPDGSMPDASQIWSVQAPFAVPADSLAGTSLAACPILSAQQCVSGQLQQCEIMDLATQAPAVSPDPLYERTLSFERWYDLYQSPDGQTAERWFTQGFDAGTPEAAWSSPDVFSGYNGTEDTAIWTGASLNSYVLRYLVSGSTADYQRLEDKVKTAVTLFDVTGVPGYLARNHFIWLDGGTSDAGPPAIPTHITTLESGYTITSPSYYVIQDPASVEYLPPDYLTGVVDSDGGIWTGTPMWMGIPSIDQYSGMLLSLPAAYALLQDSELQQKVVTHLTCYLKRLQRLEIQHVQESPGLVSALQFFFGDSSMLSSVDTVVVYYLPQLNALSAPNFDYTCPSTVALTPTRVLDATSSSFEGEFFTLYGDLSSGEGSPITTNGIDHFYVPNVRGADAVHLMHLAAVAYYLTGDPQYQQFLSNELIGNLNTLAVAATIGSGESNRWCRHFYDAHITDTPLWAFTTLLAPSPLLDQMQSVLWNQAWLGDALALDDAEIALMAASEAPAGTDISQAVAMGMREVEHLGGNGGVLVDPRRTYSLPFTAVLDAGIQTVCPTEVERESCESSLTLFGLTLSGSSITYPCTGAPSDCAMDGGVCAMAMAADALPIEDRVWQDFEWQRNPYQMGGTFSPNGSHQSPGLDLIEEYWLARYYGLTDAGQGQTLAWADVGTCP